MPISMISDGQHYEFDINILLYLFCTIFFSQSLQTIDEIYYDYYNGKFQFYIEKCRNFRTVLKIVALFWW